MNPQYPQYQQNPQTPGYGAPQQPQQPSQYPGYGAPQPPSQQPAYPTPEYGGPQQPSQYPGYAAPPSQYPAQTPGYGAPQPGYPAGYGYGQQPPTGAGMNPQRQRIIIGVIAGVVLLGLIIGLIVRYNGPASVTRTFLQNYFDLNFSTAEQQLCSDATSLRNSISQIEQAQATSGSHITETSDLSKTSLTISSESLSNATVTLSGSIAITPSTGVGGTLSIHGTVLLEASGLWWCISNIPTGSSS